jgi:periodic tryptophan protein 1
VWNLDVLNALEPSCILGGEDTSAADDLMKLQIMNAASGAAGSETQAISSRQRSSRSRGGLRPGSHTDAVMALSWNPIHKQVIASGSADGTVKLWDVTKAGSGDAKCNAGTFSHHKDKVQSVAWNPKEGTLLASGSYDRTVALVDARSDGKTSNVKLVRIAADCEALAWDPFRPEYLTVASEDGTISCWDVRKFETSTPIWSFVASEYGGVTDLSYNAQVPGMMVTCSIDKSVTLWDAHNVQNDNVIKFLPPRPCGSKDMCAGKLYAVGFYPSSPWLLGCGGSGNLLSLWDLSSEETIQKRFRGRLGSGTIEPEPVKEDEYQAMMSGKDEHSSTNATNSNGKGSDQKKKKSKRKAHRKS